MASVDSDASKQDKSGRARTDRVAAVLVGLVVVLALGRAASAKPIAEDFPAPAIELSKNAFFAMAADERKMRRDAAHDFPADAWSQDDAFHNFEFKRPRDIAHDKKMSLEDVLSAIDVGMREHWPRPRGVAMNPSVPPCRPRPIH